MLGFEPILPGSQQDPVRLTFGHRGAAWCVLVFNYKHQWPTTWKTKSQNLKMHHFFNTVPVENFQFWPFALHWNMHVELQSLFWNPAVTNQSTLLNHHVKDYDAIKYWQYILLPYIYILLRNRKTFTRYIWEGMVILISKDRVFYNQTLEITQVVINIK